MTTDRQAHWDAAYAQGEQTRSWFQEQAAPSLAALAAAGVRPGDSVIDIGGGTSRLVDGLLALGHDDLTVLDVSATALAIAQTRLGDLAPRVTWITADLLDWLPPRTYAAWHDRAVLHFLTDPVDQQAYSDLLRRSTRPGSVAVLAAFSPDGPRNCSGLPVARHDSGTLAALVGPDWTLLTSDAQTHQTPAGAAQAFTWATLRRDR